jgi:hypothetical protein
MSSEPVPADAGRGDAPARYAAEPEGPWWEDEEDLPGADPLTAGELAEVREAARDEAAADAGVAAEMARLVEHNIPEAGGRTCLCNTGPKCRHDHRLKQHPRWQVDQLPDGTFRWTTPSGRTYDTEPTRYPV